MLTSALVPPLRVPSVNRLRDIASHTSISIIGYFAGDWHVHRVGQIERGQLIFLLVTRERIYEIKRFVAGINYIEQQVTRCQILF